MTSCTLPHCRVAGVAAAVPDRVRALEDDTALWTVEDVRKVAASTGVEQRHVSHHLTTADLCQAAAERLLSQTGCAADQIDALIFVSQTADYLLPATACCLQDRLGLAKGCASLDVALGCSGYVYGLWLASSLIAAGSASKVLLLVGDTVHRLCSPEDRSVALLFGDAGTATLLERDTTAPPRTSCWARMERENPTFVCPWAASASPERRRP